jgi:hypothetical protein
MEGDHESWLFVPERPSDRTASFNTRFLSSPFNWSGILLYASTPKAAQSNRLAMDSYTRVGDSISTNGTAQQTPYIRKELLERKYHAAKKRLFCFDYDVRPFVFPSRRKT